MSCIHCENYVGWQKNCCYCGECLNCNGTGFEWVESQGMPGSEDYQGWYKVSCYCDKGQLFVDMAMTAYGDNMSDFDPNLDCFVDKTKECDNCGECTPKEDQ